MNSNLTKSSKFVVFGMLGTISGIFLNVNLSSAAVLNYLIEGDFTDNSSFSGHFSYDSSEVNNSGQFELLSFEIFIDNEFFTSSEIEPFGQISRFSNDISGDFSFLEFGNTIGIPEAPAPTGILMSLININPPNPNQAPISLATMDGVMVVDGGATSPSFASGKTIIPQSVLISLKPKSVPESSLISGLFVVAGLSLKLKSQNK